MTPAAGQIDAILAASKRIAGLPAWRPGSGARGERSEIVQFRAQLEVDGVIRTDVMLAGNAGLFLPVQPMTLVLVCGLRPVERLDLSPGQAHVNPATKGVPATLRGLVIAPGTHHRHPWALNRDWPADANLPVAEPWPMVHSTAQAIQAFLARLAIGGTLPPPPHEPRLMS